MLTVPDPFYPFILIPYLPLHTISSKKLNYHDSHYVELSKLTIPIREKDIRDLAKENLNLIGVMYQND